VVLLGLGNAGMLYLEDWPEWWDADRLPSIPGDAGGESVVSNDRENGCEDTPWSWKVVQVHVLRVGELEVNDARSVDIRRCGAKAVAFERWRDTIGKPAIVLAGTSKSIGSSSMPCMILGLVGLLDGGPRI
jgi:hypothetical protein